MLSMSLGIRGLVADFLDIVNVLRDNGVLPVIAVGNEGPGTSRSPGNYPKALSVGAHDARSASRRLLLQPAIQAAVPSRWRPTWSRPGVDVVSARPAAAGAHCPARRWPPRTSPGSPRCCCRRARTHRRASLERAIFALRSAARWTSSGPIAAPSTGCGRSRRCWPEPVRSGPGRTSDVGVGSPWVEPAIATAEHDRRPTPLNHVRSRGGDPAAAGAPGGSRRADLWTRGGYGRGGRESTEGIGAGWRRRRPSSRTSWIALTAVADSATIARIAALPLCRPALDRRRDNAVQADGLRFGDVGISECRVRPASTSTTTSASPASIGLPDASSSVRWKSESWAR